MKIGIEAQRIFRKKKHGMDMVALELIRNLQEIDRENEYFIFVKPDEDNAVLQQTSNFQIVELEGGAYPFWEQLALPKAAAEAGCQVLHCTSNTAPLRCSIPIVTTLHDIIYMESTYAGILTGGASAYQKVGNIYRKIVVPRVVQKSSKIITVSDFEKERIGAYFTMKDDGKLTAVYNGVSTHFKPVTNAGTLQNIKEKYNLPDRYFFFLGNTDPKKNTRGVLKAFAGFLKQTGEDYKLVMLDYDRAELINVLTETGTMEIADKIVLTGYVANTDLPAIYAQCKLFLYPSLRESFGIPMLEAMACAVPVITSNTSSMPEVAGDAALLVNPFNPAEITAAMIKLYNDEDACRQLAAAGIKRAARFSWKAMAKDCLQIYREVIKSKC